MITDEGSNQKIESKYFYQNSEFKNNDVNISKERALNSQKSSKTYFGSFTITTPGGNTVQKKIILKSN